MWSRSTNVTDRRTTCNLNTALCTSASRGKNYAKLTFRYKTILRFCLTLHIWLPLCFHVLPIAQCIMPTRKSRYRKDDRAMRPIWVPWTLYVSAKWADDCARIATLQSYRNYFRSVPTKVTGYINVTDGQSDGRYTVASPRGKTRETKCRRYYRYRRYLKTDMDHHYMYIRALGLHVRADCRRCMQLEA